MTTPEPQSPAAAPRPASGWALRIGTLAGIPLRVHATFLLLLVWFGHLSHTRTGDALGGIVFLLLIFLCVVLHELGHALAARRFGVRTREIVLYPIGGIARLEGMPSGWAELWIALAGPAVNLVLAAVLLVFVLFGPVPWPAGAEEMLGRGGLLPRLLVANVILFTFNLLPAFPMDGGRVLRAGLSLALPESRATTIAARVGQAMAVGFAILGALTGNVILFLIALFVYLGASQEAAFARRRVRLAGLRARDVMLEAPVLLAPHATLGQALERLVAAGQRDFPVVDGWGRLAGVLPSSTLLSALERFGPEASVLDVMHRQVPAVPPEAGLERVLECLQSAPHLPVVVVRDEGPLGLITTDSLGAALRARSS